MNDWLFFGNRCDCGELLDILEWRLAIRKLETSILEARTRDCCQEHVAWLERLNQPVPGKNL